VQGVLILTTSAHSALDNNAGRPAESEGGNMAIMLQVERETLIEKLAVATAFLKYRAHHGGGYPKPGEVAAARQEIVNDPACAKLLAPTETECTALLRQHGFTPPVVRRVKKT
jgi:hypothetical protein